jgi:inosine-uridine nucleoside N-ribohydrolase
MAPLNRIIIDTDPGMSSLDDSTALSNNAAGVDDVLAMLLALASNPEEVEILMLSVTYGNVEVQRYNFPSRSLTESHSRRAHERFGTAGYFLVGKSQIGSFKWSEQSS